MLFGHFIAWLSPESWNGTAIILGKSIAELDPRDVAYYAIGLSRVL
jgi:hypothetical protein